MRVKKYIPTYLYRSIDEIDYEMLKKNGKKLLVFDVDNTLVPYDVKIMPTSLKLFLDHLKEMGFELMILSNNSSQRVKRFLNGYEMAFISRACKPLTVGIKKLIKQVPYDKKSIVLIGDQMKTDIACSHKVGIDSILVKSINRNGEHWYTKLLRSNEKKIVQAISKIDAQKGEQLHEFIQ